MPTELIFNIRKVLRFEANVVPMFPLKLLYGNYLDAIALNAKPSDSFIAWLSIEIRLYLAWQS